MEQVNSGDYLDGPNDLATYGGLWTSLLGAALDTERSREFLLRAAKQYADTPSEET